MKETMKKLLLAAAALCACIGMNAQTSQTRNEFSVGYSQFTVLEGAYLFGGIFGASGTGGAAGVGDAFGASGTGGAAEARGVFGTSGSGCAEETGVISGTGGGVF